MTTKTRIKLKNRSHTYNINRHRPRHGHKCTKFYIMPQYNDGYMYQATPKATFKAQFMKKLSNTEAE